MSAQRLLCLSSYALIAWGGTSLVWADQPEELEGTRGGPKEERSPGFEDNQSSEALAREGIVALENRETPERSASMIALGVLDTNARSIYWEVPLTVGVLGLFASVYFWIRSRDGRRMRELGENASHRELVNSLPVLIWFSDREGSVFYLNQYWRNLVGETAAKALGRNWENYIHPEDLADCRYEYKLAVQEKHDFRFEGRLLTKSGEYRWFSHLAQPKLDTNGEVLHYVGLSTDISEKRELEGEVAENRKELAHLSRITMMGALSTAFAHELNQPLGSILLNAQTAQRYLAQDPPNLKELNEILHDIVKEDQRAGEIISRTRHMLKKGERLHGKFNVSKMLEEVEVMLKSELMHRATRLSLQVEYEELEVLGDSLSLQQVMVNLIMNACEAMEDLPSEKRRVVLRSSLKGSGELVLSVLDNGPGLSEKEKTKLFEPFYTTKKSGLGLGLAICRTIAKDHGGTLIAENSKQGGAVFSMVLPIAPFATAGSGDFAVEGERVDYFLRRRFSAQGIEN